MKIDNATISEGKRRLKKLSDTAKANARAAITSNDPELENYREVMFYNEGLREKFFESLLISEGDNGIDVILILSGAPRGMANVIAAPRKPADMEAAEKEALYLLTAAWVAILDYKAKMADGTADQHFNFSMNGGLVLSIPREVMNFIGNRVPTKVDAATKAVVLQRSVKNFDDSFTGELDSDTWEKLEDKEHAIIMEAAACLLCVGFFTEEAARAAAAEIAA
ncbi:MAG: hypothetical protein ABJN42_07855 [Roseibium sp.]|uniref:hypothetical protein n=1 Tax=Roseibium sp. TaxID=1936156 RepID=UPI0032999768